MIDLIKLQEDIIRHRVSEDYLKSNYDNDYKKVIDPEYDVYEYLHLMPDMDKGVEILKKNLENNNTIIGCVDLDQDGLGSGVVIKRILTDLFQHPSDKILILPNRRSKGRGFTNFLKNIIVTYKQTKDETTNLVLLADHGIGDEARYKSLKEMTGMDIILTDHHEVNYNNYPSSCDAVINVHREECKFDRSICGCCTVFLFLVYAYWKIKGVKDIHAFKDVLPFVALTTIVDAMPLHTPINRYLIKLGYKYMNSSEDVLWNSLAKKYKLGNEILFHHAGGKIGPLFNSGNRMGVETLAYKLLASTTQEDFDKNFEQMEHINKIRKTMKRELMEICLKDLEGTDIKSVIIINLKTDVGIGGSVAGDVGQMFNRPVIAFNMLKEGDSSYNGSARCPFEDIRYKDVMEEIMNEYPGMITNLGGHANAFGIAIVKERLDEFKSIVEDKTAKVLSSIDFNKPLEYEFEILPESLDHHLCDAVYQCGPYGREFEEPIFLIKDLIIDDIFIISSFAKLKFKTSNLTTNIIATWFFSKITKMGINVKNIKQKLHLDDIVDIYFTIEKSSYGFDIKLIDVVVKGVA